MLPHITWFAYATTTLILLAVYYAAILVYAYITNKPPDPAPVPLQKEEWMDQILAALEETLRNAERKRYHPDEVILALQRKIQEFKNM